MSSKPTFTKLDKIQGICRVQRCPNDATWETDWNDGKVIKNVCTTHKKEFEQKQSDWSEVAERFGSRIPSCV